MSEWDVFSLQPTAARIIRTAVAKDRVPQAYLFYGLPGTGKWAAALRTAQLLMCPASGMPDHRSCRTCRRIASYTHPDVLWLPPLAARDRARSTTGTDDAAATTSGQDEELQEIFARKRKDPWTCLDYLRRPLITINRIRAMQGTLAHTAVEGPRKIGIIIDAETMRPEIQSVLLKTIEEPPPHTHLVLTASDTSAMLPTILSRCQPVRFAPLSPALIERRLADEHNLPQERAAEVAGLCGGSWSHAVRLVDEEWSAWREAAGTLWDCARRESPDRLIAAIDTVFQQRPTPEQVRHMVDTWKSMVHTAVMAIIQTPDTGRVNTDLPPLPGLFRCRSILDDARASLIGNVTPRTAIAAALLKVRDALG